MYAELKSRRNYWQFKTLFLQVRCMHLLRLWRIFVPSLDPLYLIVFIQSWG